MKKLILFVLFILLSFSASNVFAGNSDPKSTGDKSPITTTVTKLTDEQITLLKNRVEEIRVMDKTNMTPTEKQDLRNELKDIKEAIKRDGGYIIIGGSSLLLVIILLIILL